MHSSAAVPPDFLLARGKSKCLNVSVVENFDFGLQLLKKNKIVWNLNKALENHKGTGVGGMCAPFPALPRVKEAKQTTRTFC